MYVNGTECARGDVANGKIYVKIDPLVWETTGLCDALAGLCAELADVFTDEMGICEAFFVAEKTLDVSRVMELYGFLKSHLGGELVYVAGYDDEYLRTLDDYKWAVMRCEL